MCYFKFFFYDILKGVRTTTTKNSMSFSCRALMGHHHFFAVFAIGDTQYPLPVLAKQHASREWGASRCFTYLKSQSVMYVYICTFRGISSASFRKRLCTSSVAQSWELIDFGLLTDAFADNSFDPNVALLQIQDECYQAQRWTAKRCGRGFKSSLFVQQDSVWDSHDRILFELDPALDKKLHMSTRCFSIMFTVCFGNLLPKQRRFLTSELSIYYAESVVINSIVHMCMRLWNASCMQRVTEVFCDWNVHNPESRMTLIRQEGCCEPVMGYVFTDSAFYKHCVAPSTHDATRLVWA
jgi:hypothetical protein